MLAGPLQGHQLGDSPLPNLNPASQVHLKSKRCVTPLRGLFQGLGAHGKCREMCRAALGGPAPGEAPVPNGYPQHGLGTCWSQGKWRRWEGRGGQGGPWEEARYVHACHEEDGTQRISVTRRVPGDGTAGGRRLSERASSAARQPWREAELDAPWRNQPQQSHCSNPAASQGPDPVPASTSTNWMMLSPRAGGLLAKGIK